MKNLTTEAGPAKTSSTAHIDAINQTFAVFRRNYHNQYFRAYSDEKELNITKRLWLDSLQQFSVNAILLATKSIIESSEYLPTLHTMIKHCHASQTNGLPDSHTAYIEACNSRSPKTSYSWTHPAIYHAGKQTGWFFLANNNEKHAFPIFKEKYENICARISQGEEFSTPKSKLLPSETFTPLTKEKSLKKVAKLIKLLDE